MGGLVSEGDGWMDFCGGMNGWMFVGMDGWIGECFWISK